MMMIISIVFLVILHWFRDIMIESNVVVTLVVSTGQRHNVVKIKTGQPFIDSTHQTFRARDYD